MTSIVRERDVYRTSDLALAAALSLFYPLDAIDRRADGPVVFVFRRAAHLDSLLTSTVFPGNSELPFI